MTTVLILGLPGAGKSTVAEMLTEQRGYTWLSASTVLREHAQRHPAVAADWQSRWSQGEYAPDAHVLPVLWDAYNSHDGGVLLDGYPRTAHQLKDFLARGGVLDTVLLLQVEQSTAASRLRDRAAREGRADDDEAVVQRRLAAEAGRIEQLCAMTEVRDVLFVVHAESSPFEVTSHMLEAMT